jgi:hypothetical protein
MAFSDWSTTAASNGTTLGVNIGEGCPPGNVNNAIRQAMADMRTAINPALDDFLSSTSLSSARTALGVPSSSTSLTNFGALTNAANKLPYMTGSDAWSTTDLTAFARTLLAAGDASAFNALLSGGTAVGVLAASIANPGYVKLNLAGNNFIIQWGSTGVSSAGGSITYPTAFASFSVAVCNSNNSDPQNNGAVVTSTTTTGFNYATGASTGSGTLFWIAVGK